MVCAAGVLLFSPDFYNIAELAEIFLAIDDAIRPYFVIINRAGRKLAVRKGSSFGDIACKAVIAGSSFPAVDGISCPAGYGTPSQPGFSSTEGTAGSNRRCVKSGSASGD